MITTNNILYEQQQQRNDLPLKAFNKLYYRQQQQQQQDHIKARSKSHCNRDFISVTQSYLVIDDEYLRSKSTRHLNNTATGQELLHIDDNCVNFLAHCLNNQNENIQKQHKSLIRILKTKFNRTKSRTDSNGASNSDEKLSSDDLKVDHSTSTTTSGSLKSTRSTAHMPKTDIYSQVANKKLRKLIPFYYGLKNHGNTCFINAIVQPIVHIEPFCFYFLSNNLMNQIYLLQQQQQTTAADTNQPVQTFYLLKAFNALLISMWSNKYEQQHSLDFKNLCGYLNKQFSGQDQNDALEFCLWFLNNLNDEFIQFNKLSHQYTIKVSSSAFQASQTSTTSLIDDLFTTDIKSILKCCKCHYTSVKHENTMCISLPLPQTANRNMHFNLLLTSKNTVQSICNTQQTYKMSSSTATRPQSHTQVYSKSVFYVESTPEPDVNVCLRISLNLPIGGHVSDIHDQIEKKFGLESKQLIMLELNSNGFNRILTNSDTLNQLNNDVCLVEIQNTNNTGNTLNIIMLNIFQQFLMHTNANKTIYRNTRYGLPYLININQDCTYAQLCERLLMAQNKYLKNTNKTFFRYKSLAEQLFRVILIDPSSSANTENQFYELNPLNECPLYAKNAEQIIGAYSEFKLNARFVCMYLKWKPLENYNNFFKDIDPNKPDIVHVSVKQAEESQNQNEATLLYDCFELFTQVEELNNENTWLCSKCKVQTNAKKMLCFNTLPPILILHFKRFCQINDTNSKLNIPVKFPLKNLDLNKYVDRTVDDQTKPNADDAIYDLFAVSNHHGSLSNGHYTAYCKNPVDKRWYLYDDSDVSLMDPGNICTNSAYILFYKRVDCVPDDDWWNSYVDKRLFYSTDFQKYLEAMNRKDGADMAESYGQQQSANVTSLQQLNPSRSNSDLKELSNNSSDGDLYDTNVASTAAINYYDEKRKPMRLLNKTNKQPITLNVTHHMSLPSAKSNIVNSGVLTANNLPIRSQQKLMIDDTDYQLLGYNRFLNRDYNQVLQPERVNQQVSTSPQKSQTTAKPFLNQPNLRQRNFEDLTSLFKQKFNITDEQFSPKAQQDKPSRSDFDTPSLRRRYY